MDKIFKSAASIWTSTVSYLPRFLAVILSWFNSYLAFSTIFLYLAVSSIRVLFVVKVKFKIGLYDKDFPPLDNYYDLDYLV